MSRYQEFAASLLGSFYSLRYWARCGLLGTEIPWILQFKFARIRCCAKHETESKKTGEWRAAWVNPND